MSLVPATPESERKEGRSGLRVALWIFVPLVIVAAAAAAVLAGSSEPSSGGGSVLSLGFGRTGSTTLYRTQRVMQGYIQISPQSQSPFELSMTEMESMRVAAAAGSETKLAVATNNWGSFNGQTLSPVAIDLPVILRANGQVASGGQIPLSTSQGHIGGMPGTDLFLPTLPDRPVHAGDTWTVDYRRPFAIPDSGTLRYETSNQLVRFQTVSGSRAAVIDTIARVPVNVSVDLAKLNRISPALVNQLITNLQLTARSRFAYRGLVTYQLTSTIDATSHQLLRSTVLGNVNVQVSATGVSSPGSFRIVSGISQVTRRVS